MSEGVVVFGFVGWVLFIFALGFFAGSVRSYRRAIKVFEAAAQPDAVACPRCHGSGREPGERILQDLRAGREPQWVWRITEDLLPDEPDKVVTDEDVNAIMDAMIEVANARGIALAGGASRCDVNNTMDDP